MKKMLDAVIFEMQDDGTIDNIARKYLGDRKNMLFKQETNYQPL